jgi:hypothetical protein
MRNSKEIDVKQMRFIGKENFVDGVRLDIDFDDIFENLPYFGGVLGLKDNGSIGGKPRFNCLYPDTHCDMPILSKDYYLIGFTDSLNGDSVIFRFVIGDCYNEYIWSESRKKMLAEFEYFKPDCKVIERK